MFTGIIISLGTFKGYRQARQEILVEVPDALAGLNPGTSLDVNGVCLTVVRKERTAFIFNLSQETLARTNLGALRSGCRLNLEPPLTLSAFISGHLVAGHVDAVGKVTRIMDKKPGKRLFISFPADLRPFFISKGSVAVNGVSLTIAALKPAALEIELIPVTLKETNLGDLRTGDAVNLECDMVGKYVYNWMNFGKK